jgi:hypothetical protein
MNRLKSTLTCSYCSKIFKDPIELPCKHNLCIEHLTEKDVVKQNRIKCAECKQDFRVKDNEFKEIKKLKKQLDDLLFLSDEEIDLKKQIQDSIQTFFQMYEQFTLNKTTIDLDVHNHLQEIRFQLDEHREKLKQKIDDIYMEMIDKTKKFETTYLKSLEDKLNALLKSFETKSLEQSLKKTEETFRNPNLLIESIREMQHLQENSRDNVSKNLPSWNLGGRQIVSGPIFSDSPYKNRLVANFSALEDQFGPKFSTFSTRGVKIGQN